MRIVWPNACRTVRSSLRATKKGGGPWFSGLALIGVEKRQAVGATTFCFYVDSIDGAGGVVFVQIDGG